VKSEKDDIYNLIAKSFSGELTGEELARLNSWKTAERSNMAEYNDYLDIWCRSSRLGMTSKIDFPKSLDTTRQMAGIGRMPIRLFPVLVQIAAVLVLSLLFSAFYNHFLVPKYIQKSESAVYQQVRASYGTQTRVELSDGTEVYLNSGSSLRFPLSFEGMNNRKVELIGEGHFNVAKNNKQPFVVDIHKMQIKVFGTTFNVEAYPDDLTYTVALIEGSIQLQKKSDSGASEFIDMKPNQVAVYQQSENILVCKTEDDLNKYSAWIEGKIVFSNDPVNTVTQKLGNWFNVDIEIADKKLEKYRFTGTFIDEPLEQVLNILNMTSQMQYQFIPARKLSDNTYTKRKIILTSN